MHSYCSRITDDTFHAELTGDEMREIIVAGMIAKGMKIPDRFDIELTLDASQFTWREISHASLVWCDRKTTRVDFNIIDDTDNVVLVNRPADLTEDEANMLRNARECDGIEVPKPNWSLAESLVRKGYGTLSGARGPELMWKRFEPSAPDPNVCLRNKRLQQLVKEEGHECLADLLEELDPESPHPAICLQCGDCTKTLEPDGEATCECGGLVLPPMRLAQAS